MAIRHLGGQSIKQTIVMRKTAPLAQSQDAIYPAVESYRDRVTKQINALFGQKTGKHSTIRPDSILSPDQMWQIYKECGDVRAAVESIARRISTWDWDVESDVSPDGDEALYQESLAQQRACRRMLRSPNSDDTWQTFAFKFVLDALIFYHGAVEVAYERRPVWLAKAESQGFSFEDTGFVEEFVPVYGPSILPVVDAHGRIEGYVQDSYGGHWSDGDGGSTALAKESIFRLQVSPNTRSPYSVPIPETIVKEVTILVRGTERSMSEIDVGEIPPGFLVLTGTSAKVESDVREAARHYRGRDNKLRVIHTPGATQPAHWLRMSRDYQEIEYLPVTMEAKKIIWRNYGVSNVEMGETQDANRATAHVELESANSSMIEPLLEMLESIVNSRMIPLIVQRYARDLKAQPLVSFAFDRTTKLTPEQELDVTRADEIKLSTGQRSINELRQRDGEARIENGDDYRIDGVVISSPSTGGSGGVVQDDLDQEEPDEEEAAPGEAARWRIIRERNPDLPSDWQSPGRFDGYRTINLQDLAAEVAAYQRSVEPLWDAALSKVQAVTGRAWRGGTVGSAKHLRDVDDALAMMRQAWSLETRKRYLNVGDIAAKSARKWAEDQSIGKDYKEQATAFHDQAMQYLDQLIDDVQTRITSNIQAVGAQRVKTTAEPGLDQDSDLDDLLMAQRVSMDANEYRIANWAGKLVELGFALMSIFMSEAAPESDTDGDGGGDGVTEQPAAREEWWVQWVSVDDAVICTTCSIQGSLPIRPVSTLPTMPGGDTECRARCRCVLVYWRAEEVRSGAAIVL